MIKKNNDTLNTFLKLTVIKLFLIQNITTNHLKNIYMAHWQGSIPICQEGAYSAVTWR